MVLVAVVLIFGCATTDPPSFSDLDDVELQADEAQSIGLYLDPEYGSLIHARLVEIESIPGTSIYPVYAPLENEEYRQSGVVVYTPSTDYRFNEFFEYFFNGMSKKVVDSGIATNGQTIAEVTIDRFRFLVIASTSVEDVADSLEQDVAVRDRVGEFLKSILGR